MTERSSKLKAAKSRNDELDKIRNARQGLSALDQFELPEEKNIIEFVDEEEYNKIVQDRRNQSDFVVDDNGCGYYDDGEEHMGVGDDEREAKRRLKGAFTEGDSKIAKKARKLAEAAVGQKSILNYARTGHSTTMVSSSKQASNVNPLDIDALMGGPSRASNQGTRKPSAIATSGINRRPPYSGAIRPRTSAPRAVSRGNYDEEDYANDNDSGEGFEDHGISMDEDIDPCNDSDTTAPHNEAKSLPSKLADTKAVTLDAPLILAANASNGATSAADEIKPETAEPSSQPQDGFQRISLSKSTKKLKVFEPPQKPANNPSGDFKPSLASIHSSAGGLDMGDGEAANIGLAPILSTSACKIDPKSWLQERFVERTLSNADGTETTSSVKEEFLRMFWLDASESNGVIYLYGKVMLTESDKGKSSERYVSCCVIVQGADRNLYVLPKATGELHADGSQVRADMGSVYGSIRDMMKEIIPKSEGQSFRCKAVKRKYAFEHANVPRGEADYMKIVYAAKHGPPPAKYCNGYGAMERVFGSSSTALELFLLKRKLMGPCWIDIKNPRAISNPISWCSLEIGVENPKFISKQQSSDTTLSPPPPLVSMCVSMKTAVNPATHTHEIIMLSLLVHTKVDAEADTELNPKLMRRYTMIRQLGLSCGNSCPSAFPHDLNSEAKRLAGGAVQTFPNERAMLSVFFDRLHQEDPDILASHNLFGFEFDVLLARAVANKLPMWSKLGRLRRTRPPKGISDRDVAAGRILCDTYKAAKEFLRETTYSLTALSQSQLNFERIEVDPVDVPRFFSSSEDILKLAHHTSCDAMLVQRLMLKLQVVPLTKQLTNLSGNLWTRTIRGARAERIEYLLLHEFHALKYILPERKAFDNDGKGPGGKRGAAAAMDEDDDDARVGGRSRTRGKAAYSGGLVLEPKKGLYDTYILLLDFNSLYPSIIQEYNLCFTTVDWTKFMNDTSTAVESNAKTKNAKQKKGKPATGDADDDYDDADNDDDAVDGYEGAADGAKALPPIPDTTAPPGVLPRVIKSLVERRKGVKNMLKKERDPNIRQQLDIRQKAIKLTANSMYGCLGFTFSRFYARPIAALVTAKGREALQRTVDQATNLLGLEIIYGDTDSVMINTNSTDLAAVKELGNLVKKEVNKLYRALELDLDGIFKSMLLLKKKKYAAVVIKETDSGVQYEKEMKGLDLVRRDWCVLSKETGKFVVDQILSGKPREEIVMGIHDHLSELAGKVRNGELPLAKFVVTKGLNKNPKDYPDCKGQAHLTVALAMLKANRPVNIGDHIPYVICQQGPEGAAAPQRAYHPDEVARSNGALTIDYEWYLANQILPPISRLCEPIEGTSAAVISTKLGLDASKYTNVPQATDDLLDEQWGFTPKCLMDDGERFKECVSLTCSCSVCKTDVVFPGVLNQSTGLSGLYCSGCGAMYYGKHNPADAYSYLSNRVTLLVRQCVRRYYDCWLVCDDHTCNRRTMHQSAMGYTCTEDCHGRMIQEYDETKLYNQLKYLETLFDVPRAIKKAVDAGSSTTVETVPLEHREVFGLLKQHMSNTVVGSAYNWVRPSLWTAVFGKVLTPGAGADISTI